MAKKNIQITYVISDAALLRSAKAIRDNEKSAKDADAAINKFGKDAEKAGRDAGKSFLSLGTIWKSLIAIGIVNFVTNLGKKILDLGIKQEQLNISFTTFLGSAERAKKLLAELTKFAIVTPFTPDQVNKAAKALLAFGVQGDDIIPTLKMIGDVASGTGKDLTELAIIFGQIRSTGRLMGQDLLQLINAGFNPLQVISEKTGRSVADLKKDMEKGLITFDMVADAFKTATSEGGLFFNLMEKQSQSVGGLLSTVAGNIDEVLKNIFTATSGPIKEFTDQLVELSEALLAASKSSEQWAEESAIFENNFLTENFKAFASAFKDLQSAQKANNNSLDVEMARLVARQKELETSTIELTDADIAEYDAVLNRISQIPRERKAVDEYVQSQTKKNKVETDNTLTLEKLEENLKKVNDQIEKTNSLDTGRLESLERQRNAISAQINLLKNLSRELEAKDPEEQAISLGIPTDDEFEKIKALLIGYEKDIKATEQLAADDSHRQQVENNEREIDEEERKQKQKRQIQQAAFSYGVDLIQQLLMANLNAQDKTFEREKGNFDRRLSLTGDNERARIEIEAERQKFEDEQDKKQEAFEQERAKREKERQIKQMTIQNFANALRALGEPPVPNFALAGITAAFGLAQVVAARAIGFKEGVIGLNGPGTGTSDSIPARLSKGESIITARATERSYDLLEAINDGKIDDRIFRKLQITSGGITVKNDNKELVEEFRGMKVNRYEDGYFTMMEVRKSDNFKVKMKSKYRS